jgi:hypothetical protein
MGKKTIAALALAVFAVFAVPTAANAAYVPDDSVTVSDSTPAPGETVVVAFADAAFAGSEEVSFAVTGEGPITLSVFKAAVETQTIVKTADADGSVSVNVKLPEDATGSYTVTATGLSSGNIGSATLTVSAADAGAAASKSGLAETGYNAPMLAIWAAAGALLLGIALVVVLTFVRRQRATA